MTNKELREAVNSIECSGDRQEEMVRAIRERRAGRTRFAMPRAVCAAALCVAMLGFLSIPVRAIVNSLVQERMEEVPKEEIAEIAEQVQSQKAEADSTTRDYTEGERARRGELYSQYLEGRFPEGELIRVDSEAEAKEQEFCFLTTTSAFYLPADRELTDEEILEQIDFEKKRDYALEEQNAEELARRKAKEQEQVKEVVSSGGITEEQAVETATGYLKQIYGLDGSGMELHHYYNDSDTEPASDSNTYCVNWSNMGAAEYYYFWIDASDGSLRSLSCSKDLDGSMAVKPSIADAPGKTAYIREQADAFLREKLGIAEEFEEVTVWYLTNSDSKGVSRLAGVLFVREDGTAHNVECRWDGEATDYQITTKEAYEERMQGTAKLVGEEYKRKTGKETKIDIIIARD